MKGFFKFFVLFFAAFVSIAEASKNRDVNEYPMGYYSGDPLPDRTVYLTFDDGPSDWTNEILDTLKTNQIKATFFICANWSSKSSIKENTFKKFKPTLERMIGDGHAMGNHTAKHLNLTPLSSEQIKKQFDQNQELFNQELGDKASLLTLLRPPFGYPWQNESKPEDRKRVADAVKSRGLVMMWTKEYNSKDSKEWVKGDWYESGNKIDVSKKEFKEKVLFISNFLVKKANGKGMVILFHDTHLTTAKLLPDLIQQLLAKGYHFATMEEYVQWRWKTSSRDLVIKNNTLPPSSNSKSGL